MPNKYSTARQKIPSRRSMAFFGLLAITMMAFSYLFVILLAFACVYLPFLLLMKMESPPVQLFVLLLAGVVVAATLLWSVAPRRAKFRAPGLLLEPTTHPRLFEELNAIAAALNEPIPCEVYLTSFSRGLG